MAAARKKRTAREEVDERLFPRSTSVIRKKIATDNLDETLKHTKRVLEKAARRR